MTQSFKTFDVIAGQTLGFKAIEEIGHGDEGPNRKRG